MTECREWLSAVDRAVGQQYTIHILVHVCKSADEWLDCALVHNLLIIFVHAGLQVVGRLVVLHRVQDTGDEAEEAGAEREHVVRRVLLRPSRRRHEAPHLSRTCMRY